MDLTSLPLVALGAGGYIAYYRRATRRATSSRVGQPSPPPPSPSIVPSWIKHPDPPRWLSTGRPSDLARDLSNLPSRGDNVQRVSPNLPDPDDEAYERFKAEPKSTARRQAERDSRVTRQYERGGDGQW